MAKLDELRKEIDAIDEQMLEMLGKRAAVVDQVAEAKREAGASSYYDPERERAVLDRLAAKGAGRFPSGAIRSVFREVMSGCPQRRDMADLDESQNDARMTCENRISMSRVCALSRRIHAASGTTEPAHSVGRSIATSVVGDRVRPLLQHGAHAPVSDPTAITSCDGKAPTHRCQAPGRERRTSTANEGIHRKLPEARELPERNSIG